MSHTPFAIRVALPVPLRRTFDYLLPRDCNISDFQPGLRVKVPFQKRELVGIIVENITESLFAPDKLKTVTALLDQAALFPEDIWKLCLWAADYYHFPLGEVFATALPAALRQGKAAHLENEYYWRLTEAGANTGPEQFKKSPRQYAAIQLLKESATGLSTQVLKKQVTKATLTRLIEKEYIIAQVQDALVEDVITLTEPGLLLNDEQQQAVQAINAAQQFQVFLLDGVTGSGKTEVYLQTIHSSLQQDKQVLVLVPEIGLTPQTLSRFQKRFNVSVIALHSGLTEKERLNAWLLAKSGKAKIVIGTRSSIFTPFANLGLIIVDEEHDLSFKQHDTFRYHARDLAILRGRLLNIPIVLGSATPSLESLYNAQQTRYTHLQLSKRAGTAIPPEYHILDIRKTPLEEGLAPALITEIKQHLDQHAQVMLFLNRRGFAPVLMCHQCGWTVLCKRCDVRMIYHQSPERLHCHHCDGRRPLPRTCEACHEAELIKIGHGTERLETVLTKYFPDVSIARIDRDTTQKKGALENLLNDIHANKHRILIGTQMLAKGHHFPNVTLVGVVDADNGFFSSDFRGLERMGQLLLQVAGRAGRAEKPGKVIIQTRHPDHFLLHQLLHENYTEFANSLLKEREKAKLPPHFFFALFRSEAYHAPHAAAFLHQVKQILEGFNVQAVQILGPIPAPLARKAGRHRSQLLLQANQRTTLKEILKLLLPNIEKIPNQHRVHWSLDVDPVEMI